MPKAAKAAKAIAATMIAMLVAATKVAHQIRMVLPPPTSCSAMATRVAGE